MKGTLYIVSTPIGNLGDITVRAIETLASADLIACEDTRITVRLLAHYKIKKSLISYHQHSKIQRIEQIIDSLESGKSVALVSDAGTPTISDPGSLLIERAIAAKIKIVPIPGVSAITTAYVSSGLSEKEFLFMGFLPNKKGRETKLKEIMKTNKPVVIYESPKRINKLLNELLLQVGDREIYLGRELTKKFEEHYRGKISELVDKVKEKGEFVIVIKGENG